MFFPLRDRHTVFVLINFTPDRFRKKHTAFRITPSLVGASETTNSSIEHQKLWSIFSATDIFLKYKKIICIYQSPVQKTKFSRDGLHADFLYVAVAIFSSPFFTGIKWPQLCFLCLKQMRKMRRNPHAVCCAALFLNSRSGGFRKIVCRNREDCLMPNNKTVSMVPALQ
jgi:hypothetical protein